MPEKESEAIMIIRQMPFDKKLKLLSDADKEYVRGYIDKVIYAASRDEPEPEQGKKQPLASPPQW